MQQPEFINNEILRACVELEMRYPGARSVMLTGPAGGEGTTTIACLLGRVLAEAYEASVIIVDANLRSPGVHRHFTMPLENGLRDWETNAAERSVHPWPGCRQLSVMPAGNANGRSLQYLAHSGRLERLVAWLRKTFRFVLWDTPPLTIYPEGRFLLPYTDGVLVIVEGDGTTRESLVQLQELLLGSSNLLGVIMNRAGRYSGFNRRAHNPAQRWPS